MVHKLKEVEQKENEIEQILIQNNNLMKLLLESTRENKSKVCLKHVSYHVIGVHVPLVRVQPGLVETFCWLIRCSANLDLGLWRFQISFMDHDDEVVVMCKVILWVYETKSNILTVVAVDKFLNFPRGIFGNRNCNINIQLP